LNGQNIPFISHVKYLSVIFDKRITWRPCIETVKGKPFRTFIMIYSLFRSENFSANINLTLLKGLIRSVMTYACPVSELAAETYLFGLKRMPIRQPPRSKHICLQSECLAYCPTLDDGGSMFLQNFGELLLDYTALHPRK
jgi:hypothetical protein